MSRKITGTEEGLGSALFESLLAEGLMPTVTNYCDEEE
jgi:hypothetical protein